MKKQYILSISYIVLTSLFTFGQNAIVGTGFSTGWNGGCSYDTTSFTYLSSSAGSSFIATLQANATGNQYFRMAVDWDFGNTISQLTTNPGNDVLLSPNVVYTLNTNCTTSGAMFFNVTSTDHNYIFKTRDAGSSPTGDFIVFQVEGNVRSVSSVSGPSTVGPGQETTISATLDDNFSTGQSVYLRYSSDNFLSSYIVEMTGSGNSYSAIIPPADNAAGNTISYYVFTSGDNLEIDHDDADLYTINLNNNSGSNYSYTVANSWVTSGTSSTFSDSAAWATGAVPPSNQPLTIDHNINLDMDYSAASVSIGESADLTVSSGQTLTLEGGVTGAGSLNVNGTLSITQGGYTDVTPNYASGSTLQYKDITSGTYNRYNEWLGGSGSVGVGIPDNVTIDNTSLDLENSSDDYNNFTATARLTLLSNSSLNLDSQKGLTVGTLTNNGSITLSSASNSYASFIIADGIGSIDSNSTGSITYNRFLNGAPQNDLITIPIGSMRVSELVNDNVGVILSGSIGGTPGYHLFGPYNQATGSYETYNENESEFNNILSPIRGYRVGAANPNGDILELKTTHADGIYGYQHLVGQYGYLLSHNNNTNDSWNLIGNPYIAYVSMAGLLTYNEDKLSAESFGVYAYNGDSNQQWTVYNYTNDDGIYIAPGQAFFVRKNLNASSDYFAFNPSMQSTTNGDDFIQGRASSEDNYHLKLKILNSSSASFTTDLYFLSTGTDGLDVGYDSSLWQSSPPSFSIYTNLLQDNQNVPFAIQTLNTNRIYDGIIPLGVEASSGIQLTFTLQEDNLPQDAAIYLEDTQLNSFINLRVQDYVITPNDNITSTGRFYLHLGENTTLSNDEVAYDDVLVFSTKGSGEITVSGLIQEDMSLELYDLSGRKLINSALLANSSMQTIPVSQFMEGSYIAILKGPEGSRAVKLILTK